ncbi:MAG: LysR family transcriptional regulator [Gaiellaceae bacterium]
MSPGIDRSEHDRWLGVEVRHLAALRAVAEEGSFGAAALRLGYAQSAISQQIAALERNVGHRLFDRPGGSRPVTLTRAGELLVEHAESIMTRFSAARVDLESLADEEVGGPIRVGAYQSVAAAILPLILQELGAEPDELELQLKESSDDRDLLEMLERGELDVAFTELPLPEGPLEAAPLLSDPYLLLVHEQHPYAELDRALTLQEIAGVPLITFKCRTGRARIDEIFALHGLTPQIVQRVDDGATLHGFVAAGLGCGLLPRLAANVEGKPLVAIPVESRLPDRIVAIAWHRDRLRTCTAGMFVDLAVEVSARLDNAARVSAVAAGPQAATD